MAKTPPFLTVTRTFRENTLFRGLTKTCAAFAAILVLFSATAQAQGEVPLIPVATDQSALSLSNQFGIPAGSAINQAGDFAFVGNGDTALFLRVAGPSVATRLLQIDDELPNFPGSQIQSISPQLGINSSRTIFFGARFTGADGLTHSALMTYAGMTYRTVLTSDSFLPDSNSDTFGINLFPGSIDDSGDVNFAGEPPGTSSFAYYIAPAGFAKVFRIAGTADTPPVSCTWCNATGSSLITFLPGGPVSAQLFVGNFSGYVPKLNAQGQMLLGLWGGLFVGGRDGSFTLVPMAGSGACSPQASNVILSSNASQGGTAFLNNNGMVIFTNQMNSGSAAICEVLPGPAGVAFQVPTAVISTGDAAPASAGGGKIIFPIAMGLNDAGDIVYQSPLPGSTLTALALLRYQASTGQSILVAYDCEPAPSTSGGFFSLSPCASSGPGTVFFLSSNGPFSGMSIGRVL